MIEGGTSVRKIMSWLYKGVLIGCMLCTFVLVNANYVHAQGCCIPPVYSDGCFQVEDPSQCDYTYQPGSCLDPNSEGISFCTKGCCCEENNERQADYVQCMNIVDGVYLAPNFIQTNYAYEQGYCEQVCNEIVKESFPISGIVYYNDGSTPAPARISLLAESGSGTNHEQYSFSAITEDDGTFSVDVLKEKSYKISVSKVDDPTCIATNTPHIEMGSAAINDKEYYISCSPPSLVTCVPDWEISYENQKEQCGKVTNVIDSANCPTPEDPPYNIGDIIECLPKGKDSCKIDATHGCERTPSIRFAEGISENCENYDPQYIGGKLTCTVDCHISTSYCESCPTSVNKCENTPLLCDENICPLCANSPVCTQEKKCKTDLPIYLSLEVLEEGIGIMWNVPNGLCPVDHFELWNCEANLDLTDCLNPNDLDLLHLDLEPNVVKYTHNSENGFTTTKNYCYILETFLEEGEIIKSKMCFETLIEGEEEKDNGNGPFDIAIGKGESYFYVNNQLNSRIIDLENNSNTTFYQMDFQKNPRYEFSKESTIDAQDFLPYGKSVTEHEEVLGFKTKMYDSLSGLYTTYNPIIARFIVPGGSLSSMDSQRLNTYSFMRNNPLRTVTYAEVSPDLSIPPGQDGVEGKSVSGVSNIPSVFKTIVPKAPRIDPKLFGQIASAVMMGINYEEAGEIEDKVEHSISSVTKEVESYTPPPPPDIPIYKTGDIPQIQKFSYGVDISGDTPKLIPGPHFSEDVSIYKYYLGKHNGRFVFATKPLNPTGVTKYNNQAAGGDVRREAWIKSDGSLGYKIVSGNGWWGIITQHNGIGYQEPGIGLIGVVPK